MVGDDEVVALLSEGLVRDWGDEGDEFLAYTARVVSRVDGQVLMELRQHGEVARTLIALPGSGRPTPWIILSDPVDAADWVGQLVTWLDEEMFTEGLGPAYYRGTDGEVPLLVVDGYGFRNGDPNEHQRLRRAVGPHGWQDGRLSRGAIRKQYAAEWALDTVEQQLREEPRQLRGVSVPSEDWSLTSPDGVSVFVEAEPVGGGDDDVEVEMRAMAGFRRQPFAHGDITVATQSAP